MEIVDKILLLQTIDHLVRTGSTGSPGQLATRLGMSRRSVMRLIAQLRELGLPIVYDKNRTSYIYHESVKIIFEIQVNGKKAFKI